MCPTAVDAKEDKNDVLLALKQLTAEETWETFK